MAMARPGPITLIFNLYIYGKGARILAGFLSIVSSIGTGLANTFFVYNAWRIFGGCVQPLSTLSFARYSLRYLLERLFHSLSKSQIFLINVGDHRFELNRIFGVAYEL